jgi:hypothetical protein
VGNAPQLSLDGDESRTIEAARPYRRDHFRGVSGIRASRFERLTQPQKRHVITVAREAL